MKKSKMLMDSYEELNKRCIREKSDKEKVVQEIKEINDKIADLHLARIEMANIVLQKLADRSRRKAAGKFEHLGTMALQYSMGSDYELLIDIPPETNKKPKADVFIKRKSSGLLTDPLEDNGGGIVDIAGASFRLVTLQNSEPVSDGPVIFDEPFKMVSKEFIPDATAFMNNIVADFGRQIIMSTHNDYLAESGGKQFWVDGGQEGDGVSRVTVV
jgi:hypothetical protein